MPSHHEVAVPQRQVEHAAVAELTEVLEVFGQPSHLPCILLAGIGDAGGGAVDEREQAQHGDRQADAQCECKIMLRRNEVERACNADDDAEDAAGHRRRADGSGGVQRFEFGLAGRIELLDRLVSVRPFPERLVHLPEVEHRRVDALVRLHQNAEQTFLRTA